MDATDTPHPAAPLILPLALRRELVADVQADMRTIDRALRGERVMPAVARALTAALVARGIAPPPIATR